MEVDEAVTTLLRRVCTLESQMSETRCLLLKFLGFLTSNEGSSTTGALAIFNDKNRNSAAKMLAPYESIFSNSLNAIVETQDGSFREDAVLLPVSHPPFQCTASTAFCKKDEDPPSYENGDSFTHSQLRDHHDWSNGFCCSGPTNKVVVGTSVNTIGDDSIEKRPDNHHQSDVEAENDDEEEDDLRCNMEKLNPNPFCPPSSLCCDSGKNAKFKHRENFPSWKDAWVVPPPVSSNSSTINGENISLSDSIDMLSAMGGRDDFGLELGRRWPSPRATHCFRQQHHHAVVQEDVTGGNSRTDDFLGSESVIKVLKTPASIIRHGLVGGHDRIIPDSSNRDDQRRLVYGNPAYSNGGEGYVPGSQDLQWGVEKQQHTAASHHSCCMADTFANAEAQRVEHQHVHWPDECGGRLVKDGQHVKSSEIEYSVLGGVNFSLPETPGLSPVCGVESKEEGGTISFSPPTPFTPSVPVESSEIRSFTSADADAEDGGTKVVSPGFEYTEKLDPAKNLFISSPALMMAPEGGSSTATLSAPCSISNTMSASTNMSYLPPLSQSPPFNLATGDVSGGGKVYNCDHNNEFAMPVLLGRERHMVSTVEDGIEPTSIKYASSNQKNAIRRQFIPERQLQRSQPWHQPQVSSLHHQSFLSSTSNNAREYERRSWDGIQQPSLSKMSSEFWRRRLATHGGGRGSVSNYSYRGKWR